MRPLLFTGLLAALLAGCANAPAPSEPAVKSAPATAAVPASPAASTPTKMVEPPRYKCEQGVEFSVHFTNDTAIVDAGSRGTDVLLRDAGGTSPQQTVFSNSRMRAEFGLGSGNEAALHYASPALEVRCQRG